MAESPPAYPPAPRYDSPRYRHDTPPFFGGILRLAIGLVVLFLLFGLLQRLMFGPDTTMWGHMAGTGGMAFGMLAGVAVLAVLLALVFGALLPALQDRRVDWMDPDRWSVFEATKEIKTRYARGEISREEYLRVLADLERPVPPTAREAAPPPP